MIVALSGLFSYFFCNRFDKMSKTHKKAMFAEFLKFTKLTSFVDKVYTNQWSFPFTRAL